MSAIRKAIIPVAGLGTRFLPATKAQPKEMLTLVDKPIIQYIVEEAVASGIEEIIFVTSANKRAIEDHFDRNFELEYRLRQKGKKRELKEMLRLSDMAKFIYVRQKTPKGLGHAIYSAKELIGDEPFAVLLGDDVVDAPVPVLKQMIAVYERYQDIVLGLTRVPKKEVHRYGVVDPIKLSDHIVEIKRIVEKPTVAKAPSNLIAPGHYILKPLIFDYLAKTKPGAGGEIQLADAIASYIKDHAGYGCIFTGEYFDCGDKLQFIKAVIHFSLKHPEYKKSLRHFLRDIT